MALPVFSIKNSNFDSLTKILLNLIDLIYVNKLPPELSEIEFYFFLENL